MIAHTAFQQTHANTVHRLPSLTTHVFDVQPFDEKVMR